MRKLLIIALAALVLPMLHAQNNETKADDYSRIALHSYVPEIGEMPAAAKNILKNKLDQVATQSGAGGGSANPRFVITANITVLTKDITATAPPMTALTLDIMFFVGDAQTMTKYASASIQAKGVGANETKAYIEALKTVKAAAPELKVMVETGKKKIVEYYNSQCDFILKKAESLAAQNQYGAAIFELSSVPDVCKECYSQAMDAVTPIYKKYRDQVCAQKLNEAKTAWAGAQNAEGAAKASTILKDIDPEAACVPDVNTFVSEVKAKVLELEKRDWDFAMKVFDTSVDIEKQRIEAAREVGVEFGKNQPETVYKMDAWFGGAK